jgi:hypothetical protein
LIALCQGALHPSTVEAADEKFVIAVAAEEFNIAPAPRNNIVATRLHGER